MAKKLTGKAKCGLENIDTLMLPYQAAWVRDRSRIKLVEKSRQIGFSWATAYDLVRQAALESTRLDTWVSSRDELQARLFLEDCKKFGDILSIAASAIGEFIYKDGGGKPYTSFDLKFNNGTTIHSMSSNPDAQARQPRDWKSRWRAAGGKLYGGKMIAEVNDPIWSKISRFGNPYPPFDFNSGMGLRDVSRGEAVRCGAISEDSFAEPKDIPSINESLESEIRGASESLKAEISEKLKGLAKWEGDKLVFTDPNGTKPYSSKDIVEVLNKPLPENFYGDGKSPYHQRDALIEWTKDSDYIKNHTTSDKAYHFGRLLKRIEPMKSDEKLYRGMSWNTKYPNQKELYDGFMEQVESGYFERSTFESYSTNAAMVKENYMKKPTKVFITVVKHSNAKYIGEVVKRYFEDNAYEQEVLFSRGGRMKILKKEVRGDTLYLTVEESQ